jgi:hypothetical protein
LVTRYNLAQLYRDEDRLAEAVQELRRVAELHEMIQSPHLDAHFQMLKKVEAELARRDMA